MFRLALADAAALKRKSPLISIFSPREKRLKATTAEFAPYLRGLFSLTSFVKQGDKLCSLSKGRDTILLVMPQAVIFTLFEADTRSGA
ncbi:hypothetical protein DU002_17375 [Corallincola holothuriorum]|uniref:Uncharacterized protein n=1 Tax=Corallincola holothuriorum TaxID=2282215 RepID=A0A368N395_9GAMM|nr:hypothetical protein DU002_17375 [Corallincola holothuriorum]